jgi:hydroxyacyl-ACP dehydratase HTD2-like protein with hotdog domain
MAETLLTPAVTAYIGHQSRSITNRFPVSEEMIFELADAIEEPNPLYLDADYAKNSRFGGLLCPQLAGWKDWAPRLDYFGAGQDTHFEVPLPFKSYGFNGGSKWTFHRPVRVGDHILKTEKIVDISERPGRTGQLVFIVREVTQVNQKGELLLTIRHTSIFRKRAETEVADQPDISSSVHLPNVSPPERGQVVDKKTWSAQPQRSFDQINVGDDLPPVVRGPMTTGHLVRWASANGNYARIHWDLPYAMLRQGLSNLVVNGSLKNEYLYILLQRFAGEAGWVREMYLEHRGMDHPGDTLTITGKVTEKTVRDGLGCLKCEISLRNNRSETARGWAEIVLPRGSEPLPLVWL